MSRTSRHANIVLSSCVFILKYETCQLLADVHSCTYPLSIRQCTQVSSASRLAFKNSCCCSPAPFEVHFELQHTYQRLRAFLLRGCSLRTPLLSFCILKVPEVRRKEGGLRDFWAALAEGEWSSGMIVSHGHNCNTPLYDRAHKVLFTSIISCNPLNGP